MKNIVFLCKDDSKMKLSNENLTFSNLTWICNEHSQWQIIDTRLNDINESLLNNEIDNICQESTCPSAPFPEHGYIVEKNYSKNVNDSITFKCNEGYILEGNERSVCLSNNTWSDIPSCKPVTCGKPPKVANAILNENYTNTVNFTFDDTITYKCIPGYIMYGKPNAKCLANGKWSRTYSRCSKLSCNKPKISPGIIIRGRSYLYQDQLTYICPNKKQGLITCKADGHWSEPPKCDK